MRSRDTQPFAITRWATISPFGVDSLAFRRGIRDGAATPTDGSNAKTVPDFDIKESLGPKGTASMDRATALAVAATGQLLTGPEWGDAVDVDPLTAIVLGTTSGSTRTQMDFTRATLTRRKPYLVEPSMMPFALMNSAAGQCAIRYHLVGPNISIGGGRTSCLLGLGYASRLLSTGRASKVICGSVEEYSQDRAILESASGINDEPLGEGCAVFLLEPRSACSTPLAEVLASDSRVCLDGDFRATFTACLGQVLSGVDPTAVWAVASPPRPGVAAAGERRAIADFFGDTAPKPRIIVPSDLVGDTGAAAASFQLAALLSSAEDAPDTAGRLAIITSAERDGLVGSTLLRIC